jgi:RNA polymerase sigma-70 factor (ECF subfamily)
MDAGRTRFDVDAQARDRLAARFFAAFRKGDVDALRETLRADAQLVGDAGGKAPSLPRAVVGADRIARVLAGFGARAAAIGLGYEEVVINGQPGMLARERDGAVLHVVVLDVAEGGVQTVRTIINPEKLRHLGPVADAWAVSERYRAASGRRQSS